MPHDGSRVAQRIRSRALRLAPDARRVSGLGSRTQGRAKRVFFPAHDRGLCEICRVQSQRSHPPSPISHFLSSGPPLLRLWPVEQTDGGDAALCAAPAGLLATRSFSTSHPGPIHQSNKPAIQRSTTPSLHHSDSPFDPGTASVFCLYRRRLPADHLRPASSLFDCVDGGSSRGPTHFS